jgi:hypothetical protein
MKQILHRIIFFLYALKFIIIDSIEKTTENNSFVEESLETVCIN